MAIFPKDVADFLFLWENSLLKCDLNMKSNMKTVVEQRWGFFIVNKMESVYCGFEKKQKWESRSGRQMEKMCFVVGGMFCPHLS